MSTHTDLNKLAHISIFIFVFSVVALTACAPVAPQSASEAGLNMSIEVMPDPPAVGESMLMVKLSDADGTPITNATLNIQGDMTHAGMVPVIREIEGGSEDGVYAVPFEWTMGGDWIVTVLAVMADGTEIEQTFDLSVATEGGAAEMDHGEGDVAHGDDEAAEDEDHHDASAGDGEKVMEEMNPDDHAESETSEIPEHEE